MVDDYWLEEIDLHSDFRHRSKANLSCYDVLH